MTASTPPTAHEEIDFLDEVEREMMVLTTADLESAVPAQGEIHSTREVNDETTSATMPACYGPPPSPGS